MKKIKDFFLNVFKNIKLWFISHKRLLCIILLVFYVFIFGCGFGSCLQVYVSNRNSSDIEIINACADYEVSSTNYLIQNDGKTVRIELGEISQVLFSSAKDLGTDYSGHQKTISLPTVFSLYNLDNWDLMSYGISFGNRFDTQAIPSTYYHGFGLTQRARSNIYDAYRSNVLDYGYTMFNDYNHYDYTVLIRYTGNADSNTFGYELPISMGRTTTGKGGESWLDFYPNPYTTYFMFATNRGAIENYVAPTRLSSLFIDYWEVTSINLHVPTDNQAFDGYGLNLPFWVTYNYTFDNGLKVAFGLPYYHKFPINPNNLYPSDCFYSYYDEGSFSAFQNGFSEGFAQGETKGYYKGVNESLNDVSPFNAVVTFVNNLLGIKLFGDLSLGVIISIVFGFVIFGVLIKVFLGG